MASIYNTLSQDRWAKVEVWRNSTWVDVPFNNIKGELSPDRSAIITLEMPGFENGDDVTTIDPQSILYEGDRIRMYRGIVGQPGVRFFTGFVDSRAPKLDGIMGIYRTVPCTDYFKELMDAILIDGRVYDGLNATAVLVDVIQRAINTGQYVIYDDNGNPLTTTPNYNTPNGNAICYIPDLLNDDGSTFILPSGTLGSFTNPAAPVASLTVPQASGSNYCTFELPKRYIIASTMNISGMTMASGSTLPPASGTYFLDSYNGILYFNAADAGRNTFLTATYFDTPLFNYDHGLKCYDVLKELCTRIGIFLGIDGYGKIYTQYNDTIQPPKKIFTDDNFVSLGVDISRDRRNVVIIEGWDNVCGGIIAAKGVNRDDIINGPPIGLGKRQYAVIQDQTWTTQYAASKACYYALLQMGRRGKTNAVDILDDPTLNLYDVIGFASELPEIGITDFFQINSISWKMIANEGSFDAISTIGCTSIPGRGILYLGPLSGLTADGGMDFANDIYPITNAFLTPSGGTYKSLFSLASGLALTYTIGSLAGTESITLLGSSNTNVIVTSNIPRAANQNFSIGLPVSAFSPGELICVKLWFKDSNGNIGVYRDFIKATV